MNIQGKIKFAFIFSGWLMLLSMNASAQTDSVDEIEINKRPLQEFALSVLDKWEKKEIDLTKPFTVELNGSLTREGRFDATVTKYIKSEGDGDIVNVAKNAIEAVGDSHIMAFLSYLDVKDVRLIVSQDESDTLLLLTSEMESNQRARTAASGFNALISVARIENNGMTADDKTLLKHSSVAFDETRMILKFKMPKQTFHEMVERNLREWSKIKRTTNG